MAQQRVGSGRANALREGWKLQSRVEETSRAPVEVVYDVLSDLRTHLVWGGERQKNNTRILTLQAPEGPASVGTEFATTGADPMGRFTDRSVVTEASRPNTFEFVTEARLETKKGKVIDWMLVHRYELSPAREGTRISYTGRITRISELAGPLAMFRIPGLRSLAMRASAGVSRRGVRNLARLAEERAGRGTRVR
jgi:hypothetical protein